nr:RNA methyltransferase [Pseudoxanthomonas sp.]
MIRTLRHITSLDHPDLQPFRTLRRPEEHRQQGIFVAEGEKVTLRLLHSGLTVRSLMLSEDWFTLHRPAIDAHRDPIDVHVGPKKLLETIVGHDLHQSMMGIGEVPPPATIDGLLRRLPDRAVLVMADGITNAENMGVIVRNCVCFGVDALLVLSSSCDPYLRRSVRNSMGNIFRLPIVYFERGTEPDHVPADNFGDGIRTLKDAGVRIIGAHPRQESIDLRSLSAHGRVCIVLGAEGHGISQLTLDMCDATTVIPMPAGVDSLNVASASAVLLWELWKTQQPR